MVKAASRLTMGWPEWLFNIRSSSGTAFWSLLLPSSTQAEAAVSALGSSKPATTAWKASSGSGPASVIEARVSNRAARTWLLGSANIVSSSSLRLLSELFIRESCSTASMAAVRTSSAGSRIIRIRARR